MAISEKDIFQSLMKDPNHAYNGVEKVWAEAQQRARQYRNNEKALALAFEKSALNKFSDFLTKADERDDYGFSSANYTQRGELKRTHKNRLEDILIEIEEVISKRMGNTPEMLNNVRDNDTFSSNFGLTHPSGEVISTQVSVKGSTRTTLNALNNIYYGIKNTIDGQPLTSEQLSTLNNVKEFNVDQVRVMTAKKLWGDEWEEMISTPEGYQKILDILDNKHTLHTHKNHHPQLHQDYNYLLLNLYNLK